VDVLLVTPLDPDFERGLPSLTKTLTLAGVEQIVVPQGMAHQVAALMVHSGTRLGLVVDVGEWIGGSQVANVTTAILMPADPYQAQAMLDQIDDFRSKTAAPILVVARPERVLRGRRLDQTVSRYAPYAEDQLLALASAGDAGG
jgi:ATP-dependent DNA helicase RecQ